MVKDKISFDFFDVTELDNKAYWVYNNNLYFADIRQNRIDKDSIKIIDSLNISAKEMEDVIIGANSDYRS